MKQNLILESRAADIGGTRFLLRYDNNYTDPADPRLDGPHIHDCYEFYVNLSGDVSFFVNNMMFGIKRGDIIFTRPGDVHFCVYDKPTVHEYFCLWIDATRGELSSFLDGELREYFYSPSEQREELCTLLFDMERAGREGQTLSETSALLRFLIAVGERRGEEESAPPSALPREVQRILDDINENFTQIRTSEEIAERHFISVATLNRRFRKYIQLSPRAFLEAKKLAYAKQLLVGGASVTDACFESGFCDCSYFISVFKKRFGQTPNKYKTTVNGRS